MTADLTDPGFAADAVPAMQDGGPSRTGTAQRTAAVSLPLDLRGKLVVVIGGGGAAESATRRLLPAGARVLVVAEEPSPLLAAFADRGLVSVRSRAYVAADLDGAWLVLTCASDRVNARAAADAADRRIWSASGLPGSVGGDARPAGHFPRERGFAAPPTDEADLPGDAGEAQAGGRRVLVLGGARSGKSATAEAMLAGGSAVDYVATGQLAGSGDAEWDERVREHKARRPAAWRTHETCDVADVLTSHDPGTPVLVDCLATWLAQVMDDCGLWSGEPGAGARVARRTEDLVTAWQQTGRHVVAVSNEVGCGVVPPTESGRRFRDELGWLNSRIARASDEVWLCTAGIPQRLR